MENSSSHRKFLLESKKLTFQACADSINHQNHNASLQVNPLFVSFLAMCFLIFLLSLFNHIVINAQHKQWPKSFFDLFIDLIMKSTLIFSMYFVLKILV